MDAKNSTMRWLEAQAASARDEGTQRASEASAAASQREHAATEAIKAAQAQVCGNHAKHCGAHCMCKQQPAKYLFSQDLMHITTLMKPQLPSMSFIAGISDWFHLCIIIAAPVAIESHTARQSAVSA